MMKVARLDVGELGCCCYIVSGGEAGAIAGTAAAVVIDPGDEAERIDAELRRMNLRPELILLTHSHLDHIGAVDELMTLYPEAVLACSAETSRRVQDPILNLSAVYGDGVTARAAGKILADGETFSAAGIDWRAVEIPGHDPGEMVYIANNGEHVFPGDVLFAGSIGRSDFPGGDGRALVAGVKALLAGLPPSAAVHPGHGPSTTAENEARRNPFLRG